MTTDPSQLGINPSDKIDPTKPVGGESGGNMPSTSFQSYMEAPTRQNPLTQTPEGSLSPFDLAHGKTVQTATPTLDTLITQAKVAQTSLGDLSNQMSTPNLKLKQTHKMLLRNKLTEANTNLKAANEKMGAPVAEGKEPPAGAGPVQKFLGFVADGQTMINSAIQQLHSLKDQNGTLTPGDFLLIQLKINKAQQEIEYSSVLLSKVIDDMRTLMNIQL